MLPSANAFTGLDGIRVLIVSRMLVISVAWISEVAISKWTPLSEADQSWNDNADCTSAIAVVHRKKIIE